jgi:hypothetical protein
VEKRVDETQDSWQTYVCSSPFSLALLCISHWSECFGLHQCPLASSIETARSDLAAGQLDAKQALAEYRPDGSRSQYGHLPNPKGLADDVAFCTIDG